MKNTLKIAYGPQGNLGKPVIKIVQPVESVSQTEVDAHSGDDDVRDDLINNLIQSPMNPWLNDWFGVQQRIQIPLNSDKIPTHYITIISAIEEEDLFLRFKESILNRVIPYADRVRINRNDIPADPNGANIRKASSMDVSVEKYRTINEFFNWLIYDVEKCSWEEQQPDGSQLK